MNKEMLNLYTDYLKARKNLKAGTIFDYQRVMKESFSDWLNKPLLDITKDLISKRHTKLGESSQARANLSMRVLRALINFSDYVFSGAGKGGHIVEPRKQMDKVIRSSGVHFIIHDLRRTFITIAEGLDISAYAVKRLANHKMNHDITSGYIVTDVERLRAPMRQITDHLLLCMKAPKSIDTTNLHPKGKPHE